MKKFLLIILSAILLIPVTYAGVDENITISKTSVRKSGDEVELSLHVEILKWDSRYKIYLTPVIYNESGRAELDQVCLVGKFRDIADQREGVHEINKTILGRKSEKTIDYTFRLPYESWMSEVSVGIEKVWMGCCDSDVAPLASLAENKLLFYQPVPEFRTTPIDYEFTELERFELDNPFLHSSEDYHKRFELFAKDKEKESIQVYFKQGKSEIDRSFGKNQEVLEAIGKAFDLIDNTPEAKLQKVMIAGFASPEGSEAVNNRLADQRAKSVKEFIKTRMVNNYSDDVFEFYNGGVDWNGLIQILERHPEKPELKDVLKLIRDEFGASDLNNRIKKLHHGKTYKYMLDHYYPQLRNAGFVQVYYEIERKAEVATQVIDEEGRTTWIDPDSPANINITRINKAMEFMLKGDYEEALAWLLLTKDDSKALNHIGVCYMMLHQYDQAEDYLQRAISQGDEYAPVNLEKLKTVKRIEK